MINLKPYVITIVGAESSGKTMLAGYLATYFEGLLVPEYAREYLTGLNRPYDIDDLWIIAIRERARLDDAVSGDDQSDFRKEEQEHLFEEDYATILDIIQRHIHDKEHNSKRIVIVDGGMITLRMWARIKYGVEINVVEEALNKDVTDLYLLCRPRREWSWDVLREAPSLVDRSWIYNQYLNELVRMKAMFEIVDLN